MKKIASTLLLLIGVLGISCYAQTETITQEQFLDQLKQLHPLFVAEKLETRIETQKQLGLSGAEDWNLLSSINAFHEEPLATTPGIRENEGISFINGFERRFWKTGGRFSVSYLYNHTESKLDPGFEFPDSFYQNQLEVKYIQPLLKNRGGILDSLEYDLKRFDIDFSEVAAIENMEDFLTDSAAKYLDWVFLTEHRKIVQERLRLSEEELARTQEKRKANLVDQADVIRAEDAVRIWRQNQVLIGSQWNALQAELAVLTQNSGIYNAEPEFDLYQIHPQIPLEHAMSILKENSRLINLLNIRLQQLKHARKGFKNTRKADLDFIVELNTKNLDDDFGNVPDGDNPDALVGLELNYPLGNSTAKARVRQADLEIQQLEKQTDSLALSLTSTLANLHIRIGQLQDVLKLNHEQIESAKERTGEEIKLYNQGRGELTFVIQSRDNEQNAKLTLAQNALTYHKLIINYRALMDQLYNRDSEN